jgi:hypothetical protein
VDREPLRAGGYFVDSAERRKLAGLAGKVSTSLDLLAAAAGLGRAGIWLKVWRAFLSELNERQQLKWSESFLDGKFGTPKTRSSRRVIPMSSALRAAFETHRAGCMRTMPQDLVFCTTKGTPLSPKNLYNRALAPACDSA